MLHELEKSVVHLELWVWNWKRHLFPSPPWWQNKPSSLRVLPSDSVGMERLSGSRRVYFHWATEKNSGSFTENCLDIKDISISHSHWGKTRMTQMDQILSCVLISSQFPPITQLCNLKMRIILISASQGYCGSYYMNSSQYSAWSRMSIHEYCIWNDYFCYSLMSCLSH